MEMSEAILGELVDFLTLAFHAKNETPVSTENVSFIGEPKQSVDGMHFSMKCFGVDFFVKITSFALDVDEAYETFLNEVAVQVSVNLEFPGCAPLVKSYGAVTKTGHESVPMPLDSVRNALFGYIIMKRLDAVSVWDHVLATHQPTDEPFDCGKLMQTTRTMETVFQLWVSKNFHSVLGIHHGDLHYGNVLISKGAQSSPLLISLPNENNELEVYNVHVIDYGRSRTINNAKTHLHTNSKLYDHNVILEQNLGILLHTVDMILARKPSTHAFQAAVVLFEECRRVIGLVRANEKLMFPIILRWRSSIRHMDIIKERILMVGTTHPSEYKRLSQYYTEINEFQTTDGGDGMLVSLENEDHESMRVAVEKGEELHLKIGNIDQAIGCEADERTEQFLANEAAGNQHVRVGVLNIVYQLLQYFYLYNRSLNPDFEYKREVSAAALFKTVLVFVNASIESVVALYGCGFSLSPKYILGPLKKPRQQLPPFKRNLCVILADILVVNHRGESTRVHAKRGTTCIFPDFMVDDTQEVPMARALAELADEWLYFITCAFTTPDVCFVSRATAFAEITGALTSLLSKKKSSFK